MAKLNAASPERLTDPVRAAFAANRPVFTLAFSFGAVMSLLVLTVPLYMLQIFDRVLSSRSEETLLLLTLMAVGGIAAFAALDALRLRLLIRAGMRIGEALSTGSLRAMISLSALAGESARQGVRDIETIRNFIGSAAFAALMDAPFIFLFLVVLYWLHPAFFFIVLLGGCTLVGLAAGKHLLTSHTFGKAMALQVQAHEMVEDGLRNADVLEGMGTTLPFVARWRKQWLESLRLFLAAGDRDAALTGISKAVRLFIQIALLGTGALLILNFQSSGGVMIAASIIGSRALAPVEAAVGGWRGVIAARLARDRLVYLLQNAPQREEGMALPAPLGELQLQQVGFAVPATRKIIVAKISFKLLPGESLGVIGPSASGKSTLVRLLVGVWPCTAGVVRLDGADIYAWPRQHLSHYIGYLPQDVELFAGTVRDNIARLGDADPESIVQAAMLAHAHEMILALPNGYDTEIGEAGHKLSGGQRQRIGLARALFGDPRFVVLDEPNSNLDAAGEEALLVTFAELKKRGVTLVVVAHRPSILAAVDKILVLKDGTVEAFGPRDEVMKRYTPRPHANVVPLATAAAGTDDSGGSKRGSS